MDDLKNVRITCSDHSSRPDPKFEKMPLREFVGRHVKVGFKAFNPLAKTHTVEHMWVTVKRHVDGILIGTLANDPLLDIDGGLRFGDVVTIKRNQIEDCRSDGN